MNDPDIDRLLAEGKASGPALDRVWSRLDASLDATALDATAHEAAGQQPASAAGWLAGWRQKLGRGWLALGGGSLAAAAAVLLFVLPPSVDADGLQTRGDDAVTSSTQAPWLEASCGAVDDACLVGQPIAVRVMGGDAAATVDVVLEDATGDATVGRSVAVAPGARQVLPVAVEPEASDVERGLRLVLFIVDAAGVRAAEPITSLTLHVEVAP